MLKENLDTCCVSTTIEDLIDDMGFDWEALNVDEPVYVGDMNYEVLSETFDGKQSWNKILHIVRKPDAEYWTVVYNTRTLNVAGNHLLMVFHKISNQFDFVPVEDIDKNVFLLVGINGTLIDSYEITKTDLVGPILDIEVANAHTYISNGLVSHNTLYGDPTEIPGGRKLKYNINLNMRGRKIEDVVENNEIVGVKVGISVTKNGWASLAKTDDRTHLLFYNENGIEKSAIAGIYDKAVRHDVIVRKGAWYNLMGEDGKSMQQWQGKDALVDDIIKDVELREKVKELTEHAIRTAKQNAKIDSEGFRLPTEPQSIE